MTHGRVIALQISDYAQSVQMLEYSSDKKNVARVKLTEDQAVELVEDLLDTIEVDE